MLFHLKEPNYASLVPLEAPGRFYARKQAHILEVLAQYHKQAQEEKRQSDDLPWWARGKYSIEDIETVEKGCFYFCSGMTKIDKEDELYRKVPITEEFDLYIPDENILRFLEWRQGILSKKRGHLYKLQNPINFGMNLSFVPEDIAFALSTFDFNPYREVVEREIAFREQLVREGKFMDLHSRDVIY